jgi:hypothetical protein
MIELHKPNKTEKTKTAGELKPAAHDIPKLCDTVIELSEKLISIFEQEKDLVAKKAIEQHKELLKTKQRVSTEYNRNIEILYSNKERLQEMPDKIKTALRDAVQKVEAVAQENAQMLKAYCDASRLFVSNVMSAIKAEQLLTPSYKGTGKIKTDDNTCQPISICKTV